MANCGDTSRAVDFVTDEAIVILRGLTRVNAHPNLDGLAMGPLRGGELALHLYAGGNAFAWRRENRKEGIARGSVLAAVVLGQCLANDVVVGRQDVGVLLVTDSTQEGCGAFDIGIQEGQGLHRARVYGGTSSAVGKDDVRLAIPSSGAAKRRGP